MKGRRGSICKFKFHVKMIVDVSKGSKADLETFELQAVENIPNNITSCIFKTTPVVQASERYWRSMENVLQGVSLQPRHDAPRAISRPSFCTANHCKLS